ncbi:MAG: enoyl-CoA hydratase/isomerase family protein [Dehalococcoidia bacterium]|nr:enoyl-CoA hydratase/isomerase family protein [Dehalococcoidia bacterium]
MADDLLVERRAVEAGGETMIITLNRPERVNALTERMLQGIHAALDEAEHDDAVRVVVLRGAGPKGFCSGLDRAELARLAEAGRRMDLFVGPAGIYPTAKRVDAFPKPVLSLIHGHCIAAGVQLATAADLIIAAEGAKLVEPEMRMTGFNDDSWAMRLGRVLGPVRAKRYVLLAEPISGREAYELGLVSLVVPDEELAATGDRLAAQIASYLPHVVSKTLALIDRGAGRVE